MGLRDDINKARMMAMKEGNPEKLSTLRMLWSAIANEEIETKEPLTDEQVQAVVARQVKQLNDSLNDFQEASRNDLAEKAKNEIALLHGYLPEQLSDEDLTKIIDDTISETGADGPQAMGQVMGAVMGKVKGRADGERVRTQVQQKLTT